MKSIFVLLITLGSVIGAGLNAAADAGSTADIAAVTKAVHQRDASMLVDETHVVGDYALLQWHWNPEGHGYLAFKRVSGESWKQIAHGGSEGALGVKGNGAKSTLMKSGVPTSIVTRLCSDWKGTSPCPDY
ncbi:MAG TPA: hypothetical protein VKT51_05170 [Candidatus Eremiobacteraceae bacterium]|nr:hypothetical protein [Candidatus Eremiobacteraceae bacterium]